MLVWSDLSYLICLRQLFGSQVKKVQFSFTSAQHIHMIVYIYIIYYYTLADSSQASAILDTADVIL